jgi:hypothetical protein
MTFFTASTEWAIQEKGRLHFFYIGWLGRGIGFTQRFL